MIVSPFEPFSLCVCMSWEHGGGVRGCHRLAMRLLQFVLVCLRERGEGLRYGRKIEGRFDMFADIKGGMGSLMRDTDRIVPRVVLASMR